MGYYTRFNLTWAPITAIPPKPNCGCVAPKGKFCAECGAPGGTTNIDERIEKTLRELKIVGADWNAISGEPCKWYEHESDLKRLSTNFPDVLFHLTGTGENEGDIWDAFAWNGRFKKTKAQIVRAAVPEEWNVPQPVTSEKSVR
jgi:hypothetical protein